MYRLGLLGLAPLLLAGCTAPVQRTPDLFLIPQGYVGWVLIEYDVQGAPPLPQLGSYRVYSVPRDGLLRTSSGLQRGWARDLYTFVDAQGKRTELAQTRWGKGGLVWGGSVSSGKVDVAMAREGKETLTCEIQTSPSRRFFVGTEAQYRQAVESDVGPAHTAERAVQDDTLVCP